MKKKTKGPKRSTGLKLTPSSKVNISETASPWKWIPIEQNFVLPDSVKEIIRKLKKADFEAYLVGGSVRDFILGRKTKDHDIATDANPDQVLKIFPGAQAIGKHFGVILVGDVEICTFRKDLEYVDHRHPRGVVFGSLLEDAFRRDFTINGLYFDTTRRQILDPVDGFEDLKKGVLRSIGNPKKRFEEDALRLIRAVRFSSSLDFRIDADTLDAITQKAKLIKKISAERVRDELNKILLGSNVSLAFETLTVSGLLEQVLPELSGLKRASAPRKILIKMLDGFDPGVTLAMAWSTLLHALPKAVGYRAVLERFRLPHVMIQQILMLLEEQPKIREVFGMRESTLERLVRIEGFDELLEFHRRIVVASDGNLAFYDFAHARWSTHLESIRRGEDPASFKLVSGDDLIEMGFDPGPRFAEILRTVEDLALEKKIHSKKDALEFVLQNFVR